MKKRRIFLLLTVFVGIAFFVSQFLPFELRYWVGLGLSLLVASGFLIAFWGLVKKRRNLVWALILPVAISLSSCLFYFLSPGTWIWRLILTSFFVIVFYSCLLAENVFLVSIELKVLPLYRAAWTVGFLTILLVSFFFFNLILSFRLPFWANGLIVLGTVLPLTLHFFWSTAIASHADFDILLHGLIFSVMIAEIATIISFWPVGVGKGALYLTSLFYVFGGLFRAEADKKLFRRTVWEFVWVGIGIFLALFLVTSWRGN
ncbi:MAG: hypothetical protein ABID04_02790 [Patescibacteria group bacterium]